MKIKFCLTVTAIAVIFPVIAVACSSENKKTVHSGKSVKSNQTIVINAGVERFTESDIDLSTDDYDSFTSEEADSDSGKQEEILQKLKDVEGKSLRKDTGYIFVGDSRFVNMNTVCGISKTDNLFMVAKVGEGYSWFKNTALQQIKRITGSGLFKNWKVIICLGINDLENEAKYTAKYEELKDDYNLILVSVNPVNHYGNLSNQKIADFNASLEELGIAYIDTFDILCETGYSTVDGLHFDTDTSKKIYNAILCGLLEIDPDSFKDTGTGLDKTSLSKKNSIQNDITAQNKYLPKADENEEETASEEEMMKKFLETLEENPTDVISTEVTPTEDFSTEGISSEGVPIEEYSTEVISTEEVSNEELLAE